ncbi:RNA polymerase ECF-type sigma factor [Fulvivirga imtechensis AK7]|uniref:RNA polymerase ECF-type sigma factor n=1 Tax=Fulvivirga imtechensis AK7 TaxID=1237149 RepID=L8JPU4_9BACT|nr:sigma-70 family RNA polymerase sigma factor [Fulvivirga imtechensis]ELR70850.1 RNA polymerase ECF-type sigma factor [Fulvivirga imtechensis AK7]
MQADKELVQSFLKTGSEAAFRDLYSAKTPDLYRLALHLSGQDQYMAEEAIQEMWLIAIRKLQMFQWRSTLQTWLTGILINIVRQLRRKAFQQAVGMDEIMKNGGQLQKPMDIDVYDLKSAIAKLPDGYQQVLVLHDIEGYTHKEIAEMLNINEGTSKSQLFNARKALRVLIHQNMKEVRP